MCGGGGSPPAPAPKSAAEIAAAAAAATPTQPARVTPRRRRSLLGLSTEGDDTLGALGGATPSASAKPTLGA